MREGLYSIIVLFFIPLGGTLACTNSHYKNPNHAHPTKNTKKEATTHPSPPSSRSFTFEERKPIIPQRWEHYAAAFDRGLGKQLEEGYYSSCRKNFDLFLLKRHAWEIAKEENSEVETKWDEDFKHLEKWVASQAHEHHEADTTTYLRRLSMMEMSLSRRQQKRLGLGGLLPKERTQLREKLRGDPLKERLNRIKNQINEERLLIQHEKIRQAAPAHLERLQKRLSEDLQKEEENTLKTVLSICYMRKSPVENLLFNYKGLPPVQGPLNMVAVHGSKSQLHAKHLYVAHYPSGSSLFLKVFLLDGMRFGYGDELNMVSNPILRKMQARLSAHSKIHQKKTLNMISYHDVSKLDEKNEYGFNQYGVGVMDLAPGEDFSTLAAHIQNGTLDLKKQQQAAEAIGSQFRLYKEICLKHGEWVAHPDVHKYNFMYDINSKQVTMVDLGGLYQEPATEQVVSQEFALMMRVASEGLCVQDSDMLYEGGSVLQTILKLQKRFTVRKTLLRSAGFLPAEIDACIRAHAKKVARQISEDQLYFKEHQATIISLLLSQCPLLEDAIQAQSPGGIDDDFFRSCLTKPLINEKSF